MRHVRRYRDNLTQLGRSYLEGYRNADPLLQVVAVAALMILFMVTLPYIWPGSADGGNCDNLPAPIITGNNQSVLAAEADASNLRLELVAENTSVIQGQSVVLHVRFINDGMAPLTLYLVPNSAVLRYTGQDMGLQIGVQATDGRPLGEPLSARPGVASPQSYTNDQVHTLEPRQRCYERIEFDPGRLNTAGIVLGQYQFTAVYVNQSKGSLPTVAPRTVTPVFKDQGVWVGKVQSNQLLITIKPLPTQPPPH